MPTYTLDPALQAYVDQCNRFVPETDDIRGHRASFARSSRYFTPAAEHVRRQDDRVGEVPVRLYRPAGVAPADGWSAVLYLHGGGWSVGDQSTHDWFAFALMQRLPVAVVAVGYRLAPEHVFPAQHEDALTVWRALAGGQWPDLDIHRLAVVGDSAGGTLAAGLCLALRDLSQPQPRLQGLIYPLLGTGGDLPSMTGQAHAPLLSAAEVHQAVETYAPTAEERKDARAFPLNAREFQGLAPAFIGVAEYDPLFDHGVAYARALANANVPVRLHEGHGLVHGSLRAPGVPEVERLYDALARELDAAL